MANLLISYSYLRLHIIKKIFSLKLCYLALHVLNVIVKILTSINYLYFFFLSLVLWQYNIIIFNTLVQLRLFFRGKFFLSLCHSCKLVRCAWLWFYGIIAVYIRAQVTSQYFAWCCYRAHKFVHVFHLMRKTNFSRDLQIGLRQT